MNLHCDKRPTTVAEVQTAPGETSLAEACEWANAVGLTASITRKNERPAVLDLTWLEWDALSAAVSAMRAGGGE